MLKNVYQTIGQEIGVKQIKDGSDSDLNLFNLLVAANKSSASVKLLRFAASNIFRDQIISVVDSEIDTKFEYNFLELIKNSKIRTLEVLLINPMSNAFLKKLDSENRDNWEITRIKQQIIKFIEGFLFVKGNDKSQVGMYECSPIWNIGLIEKEGFYTVLVRSYGVKGQIKGHKDTSTKEMVLESGADVQLAESFVNYFNFVKTHPSTKIIKTKSELAHFEKTFSWPSLFKGNAIKAVKNNKDLRIAYIAKVFIEMGGKTSELEWYRLDQKIKDKCKFFKMPALSRDFEQNYKWRGDAICIQYISGINVFELVSNLQIFALSQTEEIHKKCSNILGYIIENSFKALQEFQMLYKNVENRFSLKKYPFFIKLTSAINEIKSFIPDYPGEFYENLNQDVNDLAEPLRKNSNVPFRDAHLKNRILKTDTTDTKDIKTLIKEYTTKEDNFFIEKLQGNLFDFDFETAQYLVTKWDDLCHLFLFENIGFFSINIDKDDQDIIEDGRALLIKLSKVINIEFDEDNYFLFWETLLFRSFREYCRRIWYSNVMPNTYNKRYGHEGKKYYLNLAIFARIQTKSYPFIQKFLNMCSVQSNILFENVTAKDRTSKIAPYINNNLPNGASKISLDEKNEIIINMLFEMKNKYETKESLAQEINKVIQLKPSLFGMGVNVNALVDLLLNRGIADLKQYFKKRG